MVLFSSLSSFHYHLQSSGKSLFCLNVEEKGTIKGI